MCVCVMREMVYIVLFMEMACMFPVQVVQMAIPFQTLHQQL